MGNSAPPRVTGVRGCNCMLISRGESTNKGCRIHISTSPAISVAERREAFQISKMNSKLSNYSSLRLPVNWCKPWDVHGGTIDVVIRTFPQFRPPLPGGATPGTLPHGRRMHPVIQSTSTWLAISFLVQERSSIQHPEISQSLIPVAALSHSRMYEQLCTAPQASLLHVDSHVRLRSVLISSTQQRTPMGQTLPNADVTHQI
jgi:hypothetical protein